MADGRLYIGHRRYSSWSMRGWLAVRLAGLDVEEVLIQFSPARPDQGDRAGCRPTGWCRISSTTARGSGSRWRSASTAPRFTPSLWPADRVARAHARSIAPEMHAGFSRLAAVDVDESRPRFLRRWAHAGGAGRYRPDRGAVGGYAGSGSARADRSCSAPRSAWRMRCSHRWWRGSWAGSRRFRRRPRPIARRCGRIRW